MSEHKLRFITKQHFRNLPSRRPSSSKHSDRSPLTSSIKRAFSPRKLSSLDSFLFFGTFSVNPGDSCVGKPHQISSFWNTQSSFTFTGKLITFVPHLHWLATIWIADVIFALTSSLIVYLITNCVPKEVASECISTIYPIYLLRISVHHSLGLLWILKHGSL